MPAIRLFKARFALVVVALAMVNPIPASAATTGPSTDGFIVWSNRAADRSEHLLIARADGRHQRDLTSPAPDVTDADAQISPDGRWIAYQHDQGESETIRLVRPNGRDDHVLDLGCVDPCAAVASPTWLSRHRIAFTRVVPGTPDPDTGSVTLYTARIDGRDIRRISEPGTDGIYEDSYLRAAPDHHYLTFERRRIADETAALFRVAPDGSDLRQLTPFSLHVDVYDLSTAQRGPTKDLLIFDSGGRGDPTKPFIDLGTVPATCRSLADCTSKIRWLTDNGATGRRNGNPQWSPDGTSLVFTDRASIAENNVEIWTMRYPESTRRKISTSSNFDYRPTWGATCQQTRHHRHGARCSVPAQ
jgi:dipeptidyl aminopeptidase/acylaminoacyl peptidase